jgi:hypothetical protein
MMLLAFFAAPTGLARYYIGETVGKVRFWLYVGSLALLLLPFFAILTQSSGALIVAFLLMALSLLAQLALAIWGFVDFFFLKSVTKDANGHRLYTTVRDEKAIKILVTVFITVAVLYILSAIATATGSMIAPDLFDSSSTYSY